MICKQRSRAIMEHEQLGQILDHEVIRLEGNETGTTVETCGNQPRVEKDAARI